MAWKYQVRRDGQRISKEPHFYVPFQIRDETFVSPYYHFKPRQVSMHAQSTKNNNIQNLSLGSLPYRKQVPAKSLHNSLSNDSDDEEYLLSDELRAMNLRIQKQGRRKAIVMPYSFGLQVEDLFNGQLSSLAKCINEDQRNPGKTQFEFSKVRSGLLDEMEQVKEMIGKHKELQEAGNNNSIMGGQEKETKNEDKNNQITQTREEDTQTISPKERNINRNLSTDNNKSLNSEESLLQYHQKQRLFASQKQKNQLEVLGYAPSDKNNQSNEQTQEEYGEINDTKAQGSGFCSFREIFVLIKKSKRAQRFAVNVEKSIIPYYNFANHQNNHGDSSIIQWELNKEFESWRDSLAKLLLAQGTVHALPKVFTCGGIQITNLQHVPPGENILIFQWDEDQLEFWHEFQAGNGIQLSAAAQKSFIDSLSVMKTKDQILKAFMSPSFISKVSLRQNDQQMYQVQKMDKSLNISGIAASRRVSASSLVLPNILAASPANGQATAAGSQNQATKLLTVNTKHSRKQVSLPNLKQDRLKLVDLFSQYQSVLINNIGKKVNNSQNSPSIAQGPLMKQFNGLKMKIIQQSFPYLAKRYDGQLNKSMKNSEITYQDILNSATTKLSGQNINPTK